MFLWLKDKTIGSLQRWFSEKIARTYQEIHTERLQKMAENLPKELVEINKVLTMLNNNSWAVHHLFKKAMSKKRHANAFLYFFYSFELSLKHLIISEMNLKNMEVTMVNIKNGKNELNFFPIYCKNKLINILDLGPVGNVITEFLKVFINSSFESDLWKINTERNNIIHNMLKKEMNEASIERSFEEFFQKSNPSIKNVLIEFDGILAKRPQNILEKLTRALGPNIKSQDEPINS